MSSVNTTLVASLFIRLPHNHAKHAYAFQYKGFKLAVDVPAEYELWGSANELEQISKARAAQGHSTVTHPVDFEFVSQLVARRLGVSTEQLLRAAKRSATPRHCPSAELIVLWLSKPLIVELAMQVPIAAAAAAAAAAIVVNIAACVAESAACVSDALLLQLCCRPTPSASASRGSTPRSTPTAS